MIGFTFFGAGRLAYYSRHEGRRYHPRAIVLEGRRDARAEVSRFRPQGTRRMGDVIGFLARVGREASLRHADGDTFGAVLDEAGFDPATREALRVRNGDALRAHLGHGIYFASQMGEPLQPDSVEVPPSKEKDKEQEDEPSDPGSPESSQ